MRWRKKAWQRRPPHGLNNQPDSNARSGKAWETHGQGERGRTRASNRRIERDSRRLNGRTSRTRTGCQTCGGRQKETRAIGAANAFTTSATKATHKPNLPIARPDPFLKYRAALINQRTVPKGPQADGAPPWIFSSQPTMPPRSPLWSTQDCSRFRKSLPSVGPVLDQSELCLGNLPAAWILGEPSP